MTRFIKPPLVTPPGYSPDPDWTIPDDAQCARWWDAYGMPEHIKNHSRQVARVAGYVTRRAADRGIDVSWRTARASALLHDLAKAYTIRFGGNHSQIGASWAMELTGNPLLCMGIIHHVFWPFDLDVRAQLVPLSVLYGDKRVAHDRIVSLEERFDDLIVRYGATEAIRSRILVTRAQTVTIEHHLSDLLEEDLHACTFDCGRLVH